MRFCFRIGLNYSGLFKAAGLIITIVLITSLTIYISWEAWSLEMIRDFVKELQKLNLNINGSGNQHENTCKTRRSSTARGDEN
jgi:hypothetical protein